jgi:hypothetical protein
VSLSHNQVRPDRESEKQSVTHTPFASSRKWKHNTKWKNRALDVSMAHHPSECSKAVDTSTAFEIIYRDIQRSIVVSEVKSAIPLFDATQSMHHGSKLISQIANAYTSTRNTPLHTKNPLTQEKTQHAPTGRCLPFPGFHRKPAGPEYDQTWSHVGHYGRSRLFLLR